MEETVSLANIWKSQSCSASLCTLLISVVLELRAALDVVAMQIQNGVKCLFMLLWVCTERKS